VAVIGLPATVGLVVLAGPLLATLFQYGEFTPYDVRMAARSLVAFALGLPAFLLVKVLAPGFYARQDTATPARIAALAMLANIAFSLALFLPLAHAGLALATTLAAVLNAGLLYRGLRRSGAYRPRPGWGRFLVQVAAGCAAMGGLVWWGSGALEPWLAAGPWVRIGRLGLWVGAGVFCYILVILLLGIRPRQLLQQRAP